MPSDRQAVTAKLGILHLQRAESPQRSRLRAARALLLRADGLLDGRPKSQGQRDEISRDLGTARRGLAVLRAQLSTLADPAERENLGRAVEADEQRLRGLEQRLHSAQWGSDAFQLPVGGGKSR
jgi:hypothetical protein